MALGDRGGSPGRRSRCPDATRARLLGQALVVSPVSCFEGLPAVAGEDTVVGAIAQSPDQAERLVSDTGVELLFTASVTVCTD